MASKYGVVRHSRWSEEEEPKATVIRSSDYDDWTWHDVCVCSPDYAEEIAEALQNAHEIVDLRFAGEALESFIRQRMSHDNWTTADRNKAEAVLDAWEKALYG